MPQDWKYTYASTIYKALQIHMLSLRTHHNTQEITTQSEDTYPLNLDDILIKTS